MLQRLQTASLTISEMLAGDRAYQIPGFQRAYSWSPTEAGKLLEDILDAASPDAPDQARQSYFLGPVILLDDQQVTVAPKRLGIIDGQQRLITITIFFAGIRDRFAATNADPVLSERIDQLLRLPTSGDPVFRIELPPAVQSFFVNHVLLPGACAQMPEDVDALPADHQALLAVREYVLKELPELSPDERMRLVTYMADTCHAVEITSTDADGAHELFTRLNDRGKPLQLEDLIKADIFRGAPGAKQQAAHAAWDDARNKLGIADFNRVFSFVAAVHGRSGKRIIEDARRVMTESGGIDAFVFDVVTPFAQTFAEIRRAEKNTGVYPLKLRRIFVGLGRLRGTEWYPAAIATLIKYGPHAPETLRLVQQLDRLVFIKKIRGGTSGKLTTLTNRIAVKIWQGAGDDALAADLDVSADMRSLSYNLRDVVKHCQRMCKPLLLRINDAMMSDDAFVYVEASSFSIEHVLPQTPRPSSDWRQIFTDPETRLAMTRSLGNMVLVSRGLNEALGNDDFSAKQNIVRAFVQANGPAPAEISDANDQPSPAMLVLTHAMLDHDSWDKTVIVAREAEMIGLLAQSWRLQLPALDR